MDDSIYGPRYRCSLTLKDGTFLPCAVIQSKHRLVELAKRRIKEEMHGQGYLGGHDPYGQIITTFVAGGNRINDYDVASSRASKYAIPLPLLRQIHGETTMGWTGWVFRMRDGQHFSYGSSFHMEFFQLPDGYDFSDVAEVFNHSFVDSAGTVVKLKEGWNSARRLPSRSCVSRADIFYVRSRGRLARHWSGRGLDKVPFHLRKQRAAQRDRYAYVVGHSSTVTHSRRCS